VKPRARERVERCLREGRFAFRINPKLLFGVPYCRFCGYQVASHEQQLLSVVPGKEGAP
jgi:hypothetical protein